MDAVRVRGVARGDARRAARRRRPRPRRTPLRRRWLCGAGRRCRGWPGRRGSAPRRAGSRRCASTRSRSSSRSALALGEHRELVPALRSALADNPFRERLWGQLMLALYRSGRQADALEAFQEARRVLARRAGARAGARAAAAPGGDPRARPGDRRRPGRPQAPRQPPCACDLVRRPRGRARQVAGAAARAPPRDADRPAGRRQEPARARGGALARARVPGRHLARRLRARGRRRTTPSGSSRTSSTFAAPIRWRAWPHGFGTPAHCSSSTPASTCSRRRRGSRRRCWRSAPGADPGDEPRGASRRRRGADPVAPLALAGFRRPSAPRPWSSSSSARGRRGRDSSPTPRLSRSPPRSPVASTGCRSRSSSPPRASTCSGSRSSLSILERRRGAPARHPGIRPGPHRAAGARRMELRPPARRREDAAPAARRPPRRRVAAPRSSRSPRRTASTRRPSPICSLRWSTSRSCRSRSPAAPPATTCSTRVREYVLDRLAESGGLVARPRRPRRATSRRWPRRRASGCAGAEWRRVAAPAGAGERQPLGRARLRARSARLRASRLGSGRSAGTSRWPSASPRDGASSSSLSARRRRRAGGAAGRAARRPLLSRDRGARSRRRARGGRARARARRRGRRARQLGLAQLTLALALAQSGDAERADAMARDASATLEAAGDDWGVAASSTHPGGRPRRAAATSPTVAAMAAASAPPRGRDRLRRVPRPGAAARGMGRGATAGPRGRCARRTEARARACRANRVRRPRRVRPRRARRRSRSLRGEPREAEELARQALATAEAAQSAVARRSGARRSSLAALRRPATRETAEQLYREVLEWSRRATAAPGAREPVHRARRQPGGGSERGLAELAA